MVKINKKVNAVFSLFLCVMLCGCGTSHGGEVIMIGRGGHENVQEPESSAEITGWGAVESEAAAVLAQQQKTAEAEIRVYVCGAVAQPGVVSLSEGSRAEDALAAAGGFTENAHRDYVNLAEWVTDGQKLYFPTLEETESLAGQEIGNGLININTADVGVLCTLPGIGESRAKDIIAYRETHGAFESCEDIMRVSGIKDSIYSKICDMITVR